MTRALAKLLVGRTIAGRYRIDEPIGSGGMGTVFRAEDLRLQRPVALKVLSAPEEVEGAPETHRERLRREAASAARIPPHPNVLQVYDYGSDPELGLDFLVMELLRGRELKQALRDGRPPPAEALRVLLEAARGVAAGHRAGIVHRDVKPSNILLTGKPPYEGVKILDFGIAKALEVEPADDLTRTGLIPHSPAYAPPERFRPGAALSPASDVYQLGLVGYELLAGERPYTEEERSRIHAGEELGVPERGAWAAVPDGIRSVVERSLRVRPEERFPDAAAFAEALAAERDDATVLTAAPAPRAAPAAPPAPRRARPDRIHFGRTGWIALALGAATVAALLLAPRLRPPPPPAVAPPSPAATAYDEAFRPLLERASRALEEASPPRRDGP
jgi:serine/threonine protein kinase